jgi:predicted helicase
MGRGLKAEKDNTLAVLHSSKRRKTYKEFLKIDFPCILYPADKTRFWNLSALGAEIRQLHLLEGTVFEKIDAEPTIAKILVEKIRYIDGKVFVNDDFSFANVPQNAWDFYIGGYQSAQKWLKDREGHVLSTKDVKHYRKIIIALVEIEQVMGKIDKVGVV